MTGRQWRFERLYLQGMMMCRGHTHSYQRTYPLKFEPHGTNDPMTPGWINGRFTIDKRFDGVTNRGPRASFKSSWVAVVRACSTRI
jgi:hypothetical protein